MKATTITYLRTHLSRLLDAVRHGQTIEIRNRDVPIARLVPITPVDAGVGADPWIERLRRSGIARVGTLKYIKEIVEKRPPGNGPVGAVAALLEERRTGR